MTHLPLRGLVILNPQHIPLNIWLLLEAEAEAVVVKTAVAVAAQVAMLHQQLLLRPALFTQSP